MKRTFRPASLATMACIALSIAVAEARADLVVIDLSGGSRSGVLCPPGSLCAGGSSFEDLAGATRSDAAEVDSPSDPHPSYHREREDSHRDGSGIPVSPVPEPSTPLMLVAGLALLVARLRRRPGAR